MSRLVLVVMYLLLVGCASVPRGPASTVAEAGMQTTDALGSDMRVMTERILAGETQTAFSSTWDVCQSSVPGTCVAQLPSSANSKARRDVAAAIRLRTRAVDALGQAYEALKLEAEYDARADLVGSVSDAMDNVNAYAVAIAALSGGTGGALISKPLKAGAKLGAGLWADQKQRDRLRYANENIGATTEKLLAVLEVEASVVDSLTNALVDERIAAQVALLDANLVSGEEMLKPMVTGLGMTLSKGAETNIKTSVAARTAVAAAYRAGQMEEVAGLQYRYRASISALAALVELHRDFAAERPVTTSDITRAVAELDAALAEAKSDD